MLTIPLHAAPFFSGSNTTADVPGRFDCALNGRGYMIDMSGDQAFTRKPIPFLRNQADTSNEFGEQSLSPEELSRRSQDDWSHGAGQTYLDRPDSDRSRFRSSKGIDVWERWAMQLLPGTASRRASANTNLALAVAGERLYLTDGADLKYTTDLVTWTTVTGTPAAATHVASDGFSVWTAHGASGVWKTTRTSGAAASLATGTVEVIGHANGRLMAANGPALYNITDLAGPAALPTALWTHPNVDWTWVGFTEGQSALYAAGFSGDKSEIYQVSIKQDGTGLDVPIIAATIPDGEVVRSVGSYLGFVVLGTDRGVRFCTPNGDGSLTVGAYVATDAAVLCMEGQGEYVWFGWTNYDSTSTGLGRLNLKVLNDGTTPAYASDLMATGQGAVTAVVTFRDVRVFAVAGLGVYEQTANKVASGTLDTGLLTFGIPDNKVGMFVDVKTREAVDTNRAWISVDGSTFEQIGERTTTTTDPFQIGELVGETFEVRHELLNADADLTAGPVVTRYTVRAYPNPRQGEILTVPIRLFENVPTHNPTPQSYDVAQEYEVIRLLQQSRQLVSFQIGSESLTVIVDDHQFNAEKRTANNGGRAWQGVCVLRLKALAT